MKPNKKTLVTALTFLLIGVILTSVVWVYAQPSGTFTISEGIYPHGVTRTIWEESSTYYAKNAYGRLTDSGSNFSEVLQTAIDETYALTRKGIVYVLASDSDYFIDATIHVKPRVHLKFAKWSIVWITENVNGFWIHKHSHLSGVRIHVNTNVVPTWSSAVIYIDGKDAGYGQFWFEQTEIDDVMLYCWDGLGDATDRKGKGIYFKCDPADTPSYITGVLVRNVRIIGFEYAIHLQRWGAVSGDAWINSNNFRDIWIEASAYGIYLEDTTGVWSGVATNYFYGIMYESLVSASAELKRPLYVNGTQNTIDMTIWDWDSSQIALSGVAIEMGGNAGWNKISFKKVSDATFAQYVTTNDGSNTFFVIGPPSGSEPSNYFVGDAIGNYGYLAVDDGDYIAHGLHNTPTVVLVTPKTSSNVDISWHNANGTHFQINHDAGSSMEICWFASYRP